MDHQSLSAFFDVSKVNFAQHLYTIYQPRIYLAASSETLSLTPILREVHLHPMSTGNRRTLPQQPAISCDNQ